MKIKAFLCAIILLLSACAERDYAADVFIDNWKNATNADISALVSVSFSDAAADYKLEYHYDRNSDRKVKVIEPQSVSGIEAIIGEDGSLKFKDIILETGVLLGEDITPISALDKLARVWSAGNIAESGHEGEGLLLVFREGDMVYNTIVSKDGTPLFAEIIDDDKVRISMDFIKCEVYKNEKRQDVGAD